MHLFSRRLFSSLNTFATRTRTLAKPTTKSRLTPSYSLVAKFFIPDHLVLEVYRLPRTDCLFCCSRSGNISILDPYQIDISDQASARVRTKRISLDRTTIPTIAMQILWTQLRASKCACTRASIFPNSTISSLMGVGFEDYNSPRYL